MFSQSAIDIRIQREAIALSIQMYGFQELFIGLVTSKMYKRTSTRVYLMICFHPDRPVGAVGIGMSTMFPKPVFPLVVDNQEKLHVLANCTNCRLSRTSVTTGGFET